MRYRFASEWQIGGIMLATFAASAVLAGCLSPRDVPASDSGNGASGGTAAVSGGTSGTVAGGGGSAGASADGPDGPDGPPKACAVGTTRCAAAGSAVEVCTSSGWMTQKTCPSACAAGACAGMCSPDDKQCGGGQRPDVCSKGGEWVPVPEACPNACTGKGDCTGECKPGTFKCGDGPDRLMPFQCDENGKWAARPPACQNLCSSGSCGGSCTPGKTRCMGDTPQTCSPKGTWEPGAACVKQTCLDGACAGECAPSDKRCGGPSKSQPQICDGQGAWVPGGDAACCGDVPGQTCCAGATQACANNCGKAGTRTCSGNGAYGPCSAAEQLCCGPTMCTNNCGRAGTRACNNGTPAAACSGDVADTECCDGDSVTCSGGQLLTCKGGRKTVSGCPSGLCSSGSTCAPACTPSPEDCSNGRDDDCDGRVDCADSDCNGKACATDKACINARCSVNCGQKEFDDCCSGHTCSNGLVCFFNEVSNICKQCGTLMNPCCPGKKCDGELPNRMLFCKPSPLTGGDGICDITP